MINIAELLKDCPKGLELNSTVYDNLVFCRIDSEEQNYPIITELPDGMQKRFTSHGRYDHNSNAKCVIFPKGKTTWEGFVPPCQFKDGDIVATTNGRYIGITTGGNSESSMPTYCVIKMSGEFEAYFGRKKKWMFSRFASEEEKQKLFQAIKDRGYKWNAETKTLERLVEPKFKIGDRIRSLISSSYYNIVDIKDDQYVIQPDEPERYPYHIHFSLEINYELVHKFDITTLKPFESKVLVRDKNTEEWRGHFFSHYDSNSDRPYICIGVEGINEYKQCVPYEGNEHLLGKTGDCDDFYKNW